MASSAAARTSGSSIRPVMPSGRLKAGCPSMPRPDLVLWLAQDRGLRWQATCSAGGAAIQAAGRVVDPTGQHGRDVWPVLHSCAQVQARLDRWVAALLAQVATVARQAARLAAGHRPHGRKPHSDLEAPATTLAQARRSKRALPDVGVARIAGGRGGQRRRCPLWGRPAGQSGGAAVGSFSPCGEKKEPTKGKKSVVCVRPSSFNNDYPIVSGTADVLHICVGFSVTHTPSFGCSVAVSFGVAVWPTPVMR
jgi:hypothetical protein